MMTVHDLRGDSTISILQFLDGHVLFLWDNEGDGVLWQVRLPTSAVLIDSNTQLNYVHPWLLKLADHLSVDPRSSRYVAPTDGLIGTMEMVRQGLHLALGMRMDEAEFLLQIKNSSLILACPVKNLDVIEVFISN
jgi:hypothetical protein